jgi:excinuclease ABC subunit C
MFKLPQEGAPEAVRAFIQQYYSEDHTIPEEVLVGEREIERELLSELLADIKGQQVRVRVARRGDGRKLVAMAVSNAANYLRSEASPAIDTMVALERLRERLALHSFPHRLECVDISNIRGQFPVGSLVVFRDGEPDKSAYRRYRIKGVDRIDDTAMMAEVLQRRFTDAKDSRVLPDLLVVDGGKGQLNQAVAVLRKLDLVDSVPVVSLAKGGKSTGSATPGVGDRLFLPGRKNPLHLKKDQHLHSILGRLRDEAHRFAITYYQKRHRKNALHSRLDEVRGIGPKRRQALIREFGSLDGLMEASLEEIGQVPGISRNLAEHIRAVLQGWERGEHTPV